MEPQNAIEPLPWSDDIRTAYLSGAANQFVIHGNVHDRMVFSGGEKEGPEIGSLSDFLTKVQLRKFDLVLSYELGAGLRVESGADFFEKLRIDENLPRDPAQAIGYLDHFLRYCVNLRNLTPGEAGKVTEETRALIGRNHHISIILKSADLIFPVSRQTRDYQLSSMAAVVRSWSLETHFLEQNLAVFLVAENLNDLHHLLAGNTRSSQVEIPMPTAGDLERSFTFFSSQYPKALEKFAGQSHAIAGRLAGASISSVEGLLKTRQFLDEPLAEDDLADLKKSLVERDSQGLIEFLEPSRTLDDVYGHDAIKKWVRQDIELWKQGDVGVMPMGYLLCGPVGTGKTFIVECLAGEAGIPVVKMKNFRDRWVGSTEGNLEKIFNLLHALGRCIVFIDEADQALGSRDSGSGDSGVSGRVYSMMAKEMSDSNNRGRILWILASSRPDLIEVDLKRPGRVDVKIPLFPAHEKEEAYQLIRALSRRQKLALPDTCPEEVRELIPGMVTPGEAESIAIKVYRLVKTKGVDPVEALRDCLDEYQNPVPEDVMRFQIGIAVREASDLDFVPQVYREYV